MRIIVSENYYLIVKKAKTYIDACLYKNGEKHAFKSKAFPISINKEHLKEWAKKTIENEDSTNN